MQSGVIRGQIRNEFITHHSTSSIHRPERMLAHPARFRSFISHTDLTDLTDSFSLQATGILIWSLNGRTPKESKIREIREIRVGKIQHLTFKINHHESKLEIRHQFRHHCPHRRPQLFLHAELRQPLSRSRISRIFTSLGDEYLLPCHQH